MKMVCNGGVSVRSEINSIRDGRMVLGVLPRFMRESVDRPYARAGAAERPLFLSKRFQLTPDLPAIFQESLNFMAEYLEFFVQIFTDGLTPGLSGLVRGLSCSDELQPMVCNNRVFVRHSQGVERVSKQIRSAHYISSGSRMPSKATLSWHQPRW